MSLLSKLLLPNNSSYELRASAVPYGAVDSTSTATAFTATVPGISALENGVCCYIRNNKITSATNCTLNVNNLGAKPIYLSNGNASRVTTHFNVAYTGFFIYNETRVEDGCWDFYVGYDSNSDTLAYSIRYYNNQFYPTTNLYRYQILLSSTDSTKLIPINAVSNSTATTKTLTT